MTPPDLASRTRPELVKIIFDLSEQVEQMKAARDRDEEERRLHAEKNHQVERSLHRTIDRYKMAAYRARKASEEIEKQLLALASYLEDEAYAPALRAAAKEVHLGLVSNRAVEEAKDLLRERDEWRRKYLWSQLSTAFACLPITPPYVRNPWESPVAGPEGATLAAMPDPSGRRGIWYRREPEAWGDTALGVVLVPVEDRVLHVYAGREGGDVYARLTGYAATRMENIFATAAWAREYALSERDAWREKYEGANEEDRLP